MRDRRFHDRRALIGGAAAMGALALAGCSGGSRTQALSDITLTVWRYKGGATNYLKAAGQADTPYRLRYADMGGGSLVLNAIAAGELDYAHMSEIPPILALQSGIPLALIATHKGDVNNSGVLVGARSAARRFEDLRGRTIAYTPNTNNHYYLLKLLDAHGMTLGDVQAVGLPVNDANGAFVQGHVEAMVAGGITAILSEVKLGGRWLIRSVKGLYSGNFCIAARPDALAEPLRRAAIFDFLERERRTWDWIERNRAAWADISGRESALRPDYYLRLAREKSQPDSIVPPSEAAIAAHQQVADDLVRFGLVNRRYDVAPLWREGRA